MSHAFEEPGPRRHALGGAISSKDRLASNDPEPMDTHTIREDFAVEQSPTGRYRILTASGLDFECERVLIEDQVVKRISIDESGRMAIIGAWAFASGIPYGQWCRINGRVNNKDTSRLKRGGYSAKKRSPKSPYKEWNGND